MKTALRFLFGGIFLAMTIVTVNASMERSVFDNGHLLRDAWFQATLCDAYFGFITFCVWVGYRERSRLKKSAWIVAVLLLGNFAMSGYVLWQLARMRDDEPLSSLLLKPTEESLS